MDKSEYIRIRGELEKGELSDEGFQLMYEYYSVNGGTFPYSEFVNSLLKWPLIQMGKRRIIDKIINFGDNKYSVTKLLSDKGELIKIF